MNSNDEIYKIKYLKYKQKYLDLKIKKVNLKGGASNNILFSPFADENHVNEFINSDFDKEYKDHNNNSELKKDIEQLKETIKYRTEKSLDNNNMNLALIRLQEFIIKKYNENLLDFQGILQNLGYKLK